ncbi:hypothetical protein [Microbacterium sp. K24]|uniref:hypothetical protein n=1 Tax=Microbacterium sp. K24 TaxID=2305446 RepID=UPI001444216E|nr:hypothetical protein [Microbacterium sp. K24]
MPDLTEIANAVPWLFPSTISLIGVLIGSTLTLLIQRSMARRANRRELALSALEAVTTARSLAAQRRAEHATRKLVQPLIAAEEATAIWVRFEMLSAMERRRPDRRSLAANGLNAHEMLMGGSQSEQELETIGIELQRLGLLLVAWERGRARGRDFRLPLEDAYRKFGPDYTDRDLPPVPEPRQAAVSPTT